MSLTNEKEEMKQIKENKKALEMAIKSNSKLYGYKTIMDIPYKVIDDFIFILLIIANKNINISIECKPIILDKIFWEVFNMQEELSKQPFSFHVNGVHTVKTLRIKEFEIEYNMADEAKEKFDEIIKHSDKAIKEFIFEINSIEKFYEKIKIEELHYLNAILIKILKKEYKKALKKINECIKNHMSGGFMDKDHKSIIEYAKEYCEKKI